MKKTKILLMVVTMFLTVLCSDHFVHAANDNIALGKTATASSVYPGSATTADKTTDGDTTTKTSRWSSKRIGTGTPADQYDSNPEQWLLVDLGENYSIGQINILWEAASAKKYKVQYAENGKDISTGANFTDLLTDGTTSAGWKKHNDFTSVTARYIRILCQEPTTAKYGYSIFEVEVYQQKDVSSADDAIALVENSNPTISADGNTVVLPKAPDGYEISIYGSDNEQVVKKNGQIIQPLVDMDVKLMYKLVNSNKKEDTAVSSKDVDIKIPGKYTTQADDNEKPNVVPGLREWKGAQGNFVLNNSSRIVIATEAQREAANMIQTYFKSMLERTIQIADGSPQTGDIYLKEGASLEEVGKEGYLLSIADYVTITAPTYTGWIYGGASITQILYQDVNRVSAPKGLARDYPQYEVRAGMIDVGRMYIPLDYLEELTVYMSWYKLNETHVHINDYWSGSKYSAFRLESETYPSIVAEDGHYTKAEYKQYQKDMKKYGVNVITEIDTPYHAEAFRDIPGVKMLAGSTGYLDITTPEAFDANSKIIENLFDEYLDGDDPVIQSKNFHIGTDEYSKSYGEQMRKWTDHFIKYVNNKGYESRLWASLGKNGFNGTTPVSNEATVNLWAPYWSDVHETYDAGYDVINTYGGWLYIVPAGNAGYPDRINTQRLYEEFEVNNFKSGRNPSGEAIMPVAHPQTKGAEFALWNDMTSFKTGFSWFDIYDRVKDAVSIVAEKTWFGEDEEGQTYAQFRKRIDALQDKAANTNPGRYVESKTSKIADYDMSVENQIIKDKSENHYDASVVNASMKNGVLTFDGNGYLTLPMQSIGYPYTVTMDCMLSEINDKTTLFAGSDGTLFADYNGKVGYQRGQYTFTFDYTMPVNQQINFALVSNQKDTTLYVNGKKIGNGKLTNATIGGKTQQSSTFVLPVEKVFKDAKGTISSLAVYNYAMSASEIQDNVGYQTRTNLSLNKTTSVSALEVNDGRFTSDKAVDGIVSSDSRVSFSKTADEQWLVIDLGEEQTISEVVLNYESVVGKYEILVSTDGKDYTNVYTKNEATVTGTAGTPKVETVTFKPVKAKYVKYLQKERWKNTKNSNWYSGSLYEVEVYQSFKDELLKSVAQVETQLAKYSVGSKNGQLDATYYAAMQAKLSSYKTLANTSDLNQDALESAKTALAKDVKEIENHVLYIKQEALDAFASLKGLDYHQYTTASYQVMKEQWSTIEEAITKIAGYTDVNAVLKQVNDAKEMLVGVDNKKLVELIELIKDLDYDSYIDVTQLKVALTAAEEVYEKPTSQSAINAAYDELLKQFNALENKETVNKTLLELVITKVTDTVGDGSKYQQNIAYEKFVKALADANAALVNKDITQGDIDKALKALSDAYENIRLKPTEEQLATLTNYVEVVKKLNRSLYSEEQLALIDSTVEKANAMLKKFDDRKITEVQQEIEKAYNIINYEAKEPSKPSIPDSKEDMNGSTSNDKVTSPSTGDVTHSLGFLFLIVLSGCAIVFMKRKRNQKA